MCRSSNRSSKCTADVDSRLVRGLPLPRSSFGPPRWLCRFAGPGFRFGNTLAPRAKRRLVGFDVQLRTYAANRAADNIERQILQLVEAHAALSHVQLFAGFG